MANVYVWSGATGAGDGTSWTDAFTTLEAGLEDVTNGAAAGDIVLVAQDHAETFSTNTVLTSAGTATNPVIIYSADRADDSYSVATSAQVSPTGVNDLDVGGSAIAFGIWLHSGDNFGVGAPANMRWTFVDSHIETDDHWALRPNESEFRFINSTIEFNNSDSVWIALGGDEVRAVFDSCTFVDNGNSYTNFVSFGSPRVGCLGLFIGCDLSGLSVTNLVNHGGSGDERNRVSFENCKLPAGVAVSTGTILNQSYVKVINSDDGSSLYRTEIHQQGGSVVTDTSITKSFSDETGSGTGTSVSHKMTPNSGVNLLAPLEGISLIAYVDSTGSTTFEVEAVEDFTTALQDDEVWMTVHYLVTASEATHSRDSTRVFPGQTASALASGAGTGTWAGTLTGYRSVKFEKTVTVNNVGYYRVKIYLAKHESGKVLHYDPKVVVS